MNESTIIIGDGPGGLSAALYLAKAGHHVDVFGTNKTPMHVAMIHNYLGAPNITGPDFMALSRKQTEDMGAHLYEDNITKLALTDDGFTAFTESGGSHHSKYLIIACGNKPKLAEDLNLKLDDRNTIHTDKNGRTGLDNCYAIGWSTRPDKIQAIISAGDGAAAALDILSKIAGKDIHDFDTLD
ncbi:FAD-dependent oxidoreductase [Poriferisphaera sp. WC338]|uniref:NAD(P)/FAD-dependent oxidoreductase n=1 Tax=Poriferisphaera sp. WC338 TaxID=3425129 RepID=UPI003D816FE6